MGPSIPQGQPRESSFYCFHFHLIWPQAQQSGNSFIILVSYIKKKKEKRWWVSDGGSDGVSNVIILALFIHKEPYQWSMMIYLYGLNVTMEELWSKSYIHSRPWETLKVSQLHTEKLTKIFKVFFLSSCNWNYTWSTLLGENHWWYALNDRHLKAPNFFRDPTLSVQVSLRDSLSDWCPHTSLKKNHKGFWAKENSWVFGHVTIHCSMLFSLG